MSDNPEVGERMKAEDALATEIETWADRSVAYEAEVSERMKHILAALRVAGVPLDCTTSHALHNLGDALSSIIHQEFDE